MQRIVRISKNPDLMQIHIPTLLTNALAEKAQRKPRIVGPHTSSY